MIDEELRSYIDSLSIGSAYDLGFEDEEIDANAADVDELPQAFVTGRNLIAAETGVSALTRSIVALSLLAAQRVADNDDRVKSPDDWIAQHNKVLKKLNWMQSHSAYVTKKFNKKDLFVHEAVIPLLEAAIGGPTGAMTIITTVLTQLKNIDKSSPWITVFSNESRRFDIEEYHFSTLEEKDGLATLSMAAARFGADFKHKQVLFVKIKKIDAEFQLASSKLESNVALLEEMNIALKKKLGRQTSAYIKDLDVGG